MESSSVLARAAFLLGCLAPATALAATALAASALAANAPGADSLIAAAPRLSVSAARLESPVTVDGELSEPVWQTGPGVTAFKQRDPSEGAPPSQRTEVRVAYDDAAIYVGARLYDTAPDSILARLSRRDVDIPADRFALYLDPYYDRRSGYYFVVNAAGTLYDGTLSNDGLQDNSWDGVWEGKAKVDSAGWTAEMRIPYSQLRFQKSERYLWGINFLRVIPRRSEEDYLVYQPKKEAGFVSRFPDLVGIEHVSPGRSLEFLPYFTGRASFLRHDAGDPFHDGSDYVPSTGFDLRMGLGSKLTLNATANPDFGQVEVDPAVVNLSDVESFFQEKRPFFVEGAANFSFGQQGARSYWGFNWPQPTFFYSRRIGRTPQGSVPDTAFADVPNGASILGAAKVTGKLGSSWNVGTLHALTGREVGDLAAGADRWRSEVEPLTYYGVWRGQKEFKARQRGLGFLTTLAARSFDEPRLRDELNASSIMAGLDGWTFLDKGQTWVISGWSALSQVRGNAARLTDLQQNSLHYFQRPDAGHVEVDPDRTSLTGFGSRYWLNRQKGNMIFNAALGFMNPSFDVNDLGFQTRSDVINAHVGGGYKWTEPTKRRKYQEVLATLFGSRDFDGNTIWAGGWAAGSTEFANNWSWEYRAAYNPETINNRLTRGGPLVINPPGFELGTYFDTDSQKKLFYFVDAGTYVQKASGAYSWYLYPGVEWKPASNVNLRIGPNLEGLHEDAQYVQTVEDSFATTTFGQRYVFSTLDQTTLSASIRLNWSFQPNLSLQMFVQPLISSGDYLDFKELARPRSYEFLRYGQGAATYDPATGVVDPDGPGPAPAFTIDNPDFNFKSLRANAVLRWEYLPGSTLYLVWTQERTDDEEDGRFNFGPNFRRLLRSDADNIFLAKVTYYFSM